MSKFIYEFRWEKCGKFHFLSLMLLCFWPLYLKMVKKLKCRKISWFRILGKFSTNLKSALFISVVSPIPKIHPAFQKGTWGSAKCSRRCNRFQVLRGLLDLPSIFWGFPGNFPWPDLLTTDICQVWLVLPTLFVCHVVNAADYQFFHPLQSGPGT